MLLAQELPIQQASEIVQKLDTTQLMILLVILAMVIMTLLIGIVVLQINRGSKPSDWFSLVAEIRSDFKTAVEFATQSLANIIIERQEANDARTKYILKLDRHERSALIRYTKLQRTLLLLIKAINPSVEVLKVLEDVENEIEQIGEKNDEESNI